MSLVLKMATPQQRSWWVLQLAKKDYVTVVQCAFRTQFHMEPPSRVSIYTWYKKFEQKGCICKNKSPDWSSVSDATVDHGLSSWHLPCDSTYWVSVRCVQNFESFSIDWCMCEVLSTLHLFSVSFWKCKVLLCSPCTLHTSCNICSCTVMDQIF
jgi:hypothetical protein